MKVVAVEDDPASRLLLQLALEKLGHQVALAESGGEAWEHLQREPAQVVITDWMMPDVDGLELTRRLRARHDRSYTYVIMLTALGGKASYLEAIAAGADDFLTKPLDHDILAARLMVAERVLALQGEVRAMSGLLSVCAYCRRIQEGGDWVSLERYVATHTDSSFSHGICPECMETKVRPELERGRRQRGTGEGP